MFKYLQKANSDVTRKITVNIGQFRTVLKRGYSHKGIQPIPEFQLLLRWWLPPPLQPFLFGWTWGFELRFDLLCGCLFSSLRLFLFVYHPRFSLAWHLKGVWWTEGMFALWRKNTSAKWSIRRSLRRQIPFCVWRFLPRASLGELKVQSKG